MAAAADPATLALPATLTMDEASATLARLQKALASSGGGSGASVLDASALTELDTAALAVLLECKRACAARGQTLGVSAAPDKLVKLAQLYGVAELLALPA